MKKKNAARVLVTSLALAAFLTACSSRGQAISEEAESDQETISVSSGTTAASEETADDRIRALQDSQAYKKASDEDRAEKIRDLLDTLKAEGEIKEYKYLESEQAFTLTYADGSLGNITLDNTISEFLN